MTSELDRRSSEYHLGVYFMMNRRVLVAEHAASGREGVLRRRDGLLDVLIGVCC
jgi:hypothetical protein